MSMKEKPNRPPPPRDGSVKGPSPMRPPTPNTPRNESRTSHGPSSRPNTSHSGHTVVSGHESRNKDGHGPNKVLESGQRSVSLMSIYVDPASSNHSPDKLIQMTNYFIFSSLCLSLVLIIAALCLFVKATRRCDFFLKVFSLKWPPNLNCDILPESDDPNVCIGHRENQILTKTTSACSKDGFRCDKTRCVPKKWICDGFIDCQDTSDERNCSYCSYDDFHCGSGVCIRKEDICDGIKDCPDGRDERQCLRLNKVMGTKVGEGRLEAWSVSASDQSIKSSDQSIKGIKKNVEVSNNNEWKGEWKYVCGDKWDTSFMSNAACHRLGYKRAVETFIRDETPLSRTHLDLRNGHQDNPYHNHDLNHHRHHASKTFFYKRVTDNNGSGCKSSSAVYLTCEEFECGRNVISSFGSPSGRIVGGSESLPGRWPWLVGLHGGSDEIFFCGGVLISEHWILSAAHCVGNQTNVDGWSIHLGLTRRTSSPMFVRKRPLTVIVKHDNFNSANLYGNDIALLKLASPVNFDEFLRPVCLPKLKQRPAEEEKTDARDSSHDKRSEDGGDHLRPTFGPSKVMNRKSSYEDEDADYRSNNNLDTNQDNRSVDGHNNLNPKDNRNAPYDTHYYEDLKEETRCTVVGWGKSAHDDANDYMDVIHEVEVPVVNHDRCTKWYSLQDVPIGETMLCAGYPEGEKDACQGDSGGPLLCRDSVHDPWYVAGIVSWGINCAQPNLPGIYTKVGLYADWIKNITTIYGDPVDFV